jgi:hypothetical protein
MSEEIFDIVNERDEVVGRNTRREVHDRAGKRRQVWLCHCAPFFLIYWKA